MLRCRHANPRPLEDVPLGDESGLLTLHLKEKMPTDGLAFFYKFTVALDENELDLIKHLNLSAVHLKILAV